jgi:hypothetical protein
MPYVALHNLMDWSAQCNPSAMDALTHAPAAAAAPHQEYAQNFSSLPKQG